MDLTWGQFFGLAVTSGAAAGLANQVFKFGHDWIADRRTRESQRRELEHQRTMQDRQLEHQRDLQREERDHEAELRREAAFFEAQKTLLPDAVAVDEWVNWWWGDLYGEEADYYQPSLPKDARVKTGNEAVRALGRIAGLHPSRGIRIFARRLADTVDSTINQPGDEGSAQPSRKEIGHWKERTEELVESMHDPDHVPTEPSRN